MALALQASVALRRNANFDSDEAILGLMARHILQGRIPTYFYGQQYLGSLEAFVSAGVMALLGADLWPFRVGALLLFTIFLVLHAMLVSRLWGLPVALLSLLALALPAQMIRVWTFRPITGITIIFVLGTAMLLLALAELRQPLLRALRPFAVGVLIGLGFWSHPMMVIYLVTLAIVCWLRMPEWASLYEKINAFCQRVLHIPARKLLPAAMIGMIGLGVLGFFSTGCSPRALFAVAQAVSRAVLFGVAAGAAALMLLISDRRVQLGRIGISLLAGLVLGNLPQWRAWLFFGIGPDTAVRPSCPTGAASRGELVGGELLPAIWNLPPVDRLATLPTWQSVLWAAAILMVLGALASFIWIERHNLSAFLGLVPLGQANPRVPIFMILFGLPVLLVALSSNTIDVGSTRYLLIAWQGSAVLFAVFLVRLLRKWRTIGLLSVIFWVGYVGTNNVADTWRSVTPYSEMYSPEAIAALREYMQQRNVQGGYTHYWVAYSLDFLTGERLTFAPYNVVDRYPIYTEKIEQLPTHVYIFGRDALPDTISRADELARALTTTQRGLGVFPEVVQGLRDDVVLERHKVESFDIWLVRNHGR